MTRRAVTEAMFWLVIIAAVVFAVWAVGCVQPTSILDLLEFVE